jgi:hypothetical protein
LERGLKRLEQLCENDNVVKHLNDSMKKRAMEHGEHHYNLAEFVEDQRAFIVWLRGLEDEYKKL